MSILGRRVDKRRVPIRTARSLGRTRTTHGGTRRPVSRRCICKPAFSPWVRSSSRYCSRRYASSEPAENGQAWRVSSTACLASSIALANLSLHFRIRETSPSLAAFASCFVTSASAEAAFAAAWATRSTFAKPSSNGVPHFPGARKYGERWCGRGESNPQVVAHGGFSYLYGFRRPRWKRQERSVEV